MDSQRFILLADDHPPVRDGLARLVEAAVEGVRCLDASSWTECLHKLKNPAVCMVLTDLNMPGCDGLQGLRNVRAQRPGVVLVWAGGTYVPPFALPADPTPSREAVEPATGELGMLTPRQVEVLRCLARGLPNKLVAHELDVSESTAKIHVAAIIRVLRAAC